nr:MAG TPA: hypothetical protein [Caudoviricetes sp.]
MVSPFVSIIPQRFLKSNANFQKNLKKCHLGVDSWQNG